MEGECQASLFSAGDRLKSAKFLDLMRSAEAVFAAGQPGDVRSQP